MADTENAPAGVTAPRYDRDEQLANVRARRAAVTGHLHDATVQIGQSMASILAEELPYPAETVGDVLLCAASKLAGMLVDGVSFPNAINIAAFAADDLLKEADQTKESST